MGRRRKNLELISESYDSTIQYTDSSVSGNPMKYISFVLPDNTAFDEYENIKVTISGWVPSYSIDEKTGQKIATNRISANSILRNMNVGDVVFFPKERWDCVRTAAAKLKSTFSALYMVNKVQKDDDDIIRVTRKQ